MRRRPAKLAWAGQLRAAAWRCSPSTFFGCHGCLNSRPRRVVSGAHGSD